MIEQQAVVKAIYVSRLQDLLARREAASSPTNPDAVALKRLSLPANGQSAFTKRIMKIIGE